MSEMRSDALTPAAATLGRMLAAAREARGLGVSDVATRLKCSARQVEAMEADRFDLLPGATIARGMIRNYAKLLGVDPMPSLEQLAPHLKRGPDSVQPANMDVPFRTGRRRGSFFYLAFSILVLVVMIAVIAEWWLPAQLRPAPASTTPAPSADKAATSPAPSTSEGMSAPTAAEPERAQAAPEPAAPALMGIELAFNAESWVEVRDASGGVLLTQTNAAGTRRRVEGTPPLSLVIGNATGVRVRYNDANVDLAPYTRNGIARLTLK
jgi:cytoskeleton protein RodZ